MKREARRGGSFWSIFSMPAGDTSVMLSLIGLGLLLLAFLLISSLCIWPYLIRGAMGEGALAPACQKLLWVGGGSLALCGIVSVLLAWFDEDYRVVKNLVCTIVLSLVTSLVLMVALGVNLLGSDLNLSGGILTIMLHGVLGVIISLVPAVVGMVPGLLVQGIGYVYFNIIKA